MTPTAIPYGLANLPDECPLARAAKSLDRLAAIQAVVDDHIIMAVGDRNGTIVSVSGAFRRVTGYSVDELIGQNHRLLSSGVHSHDFWKQIWDTVSSGSPWHGEVCNRARSGAIYWVDTSIFPLKDVQGIVLGFLVVQVEIRDGRHIRAALIDTLTGLPGRAFLTYRLRDLLQRAHERPDRLYAVMFVDVDNFKYVNDSLGHNTGDGLLIETARRLNQAIRDSLPAHDGGPVDMDHGPIAARFGGDEFVILLDDMASIDDIVAVADRVKHTMSEPVHVGSDEISVQCSIGIATGTGALGYTDVDTLLRDADTAMYHAKAWGKGRYALFDELMHTTVRRRLKLEGDLRNAVATGQIHAAYQPIVSLESGQVVSFEALARWNHPEFGPIFSPAEFIPIAEETGLILPLAGTLLTKAIELLQRLGMQPGREAIRMNVNVSRRQLADAHFLPTLQGLLDQSGVAPQRLCLEITESVVTTSPESVRDSLYAIKALGVQIHMDDFGTGLSSLSLLRTLPLDGIKIDRSFMEAAEGDREAIAILHAIITLGRNLRKVITAEGLENATHVATVVGLDCDLAQGWIFGFPVDPESVAAVLATDFCSIIVGRGDPLDR